MKLKINEYISLCSRNSYQLTIEASTIECLSYSTSVEPDEYLKFAEMDLLSNSDHGLINALSNAKRAIDCQIANIFYALGLRLPKYFPDKLEKIKALGFVAPRIITKVIRFRNLLEHEFHRPTQNEVEDAVDLAILFIEATRRLFVGCSFVTQFWVADERFSNSEKIMAIGIEEEESFSFSEGIYVVFDSVTKRLSLSLVYQNQEIDKTTLLNSDKRLLDLFKFMANMEFSNLHSYSSVGAQKFFNIIQAGN